MWICGIGEVLTEEASLYCRGETARKSMPTAHYHSQMSYSAPRTYMEMHSVPN